MSRLSKLRALVPEVYDRLRDTLSDQNTADTALIDARLAYRESTTVANQAARKLLSAICEDEGVPIIERAGWSTAFHGYCDRNTFASIDGFEAKAIECHARLKAIDEALRRPLVPILAIKSGPLGDYRDNPSAMRYAVTRGGSGLEINQVYDSREDRYRHWVVAPEQEPNEGRLVHRGFNDDRRSDPVISNVDTYTLLEACTDPHKVAEYVCSKDPGTYYVIGGQALEAFFNEGNEFYAGSQFDMLLGAVDLAGVTIQNPS